MKYLSILKFILHYLTAISGKLLAYIVTPLIFAFRHKIRSYAYNFIRENKLKLKRDIGCEVEYQKTNQLLGYPALFLWFFLDDDANLDLCSKAYADEDKLKDLVIFDKFFRAGKYQYQNPNWVHFKSWYNFKSFYYWTVIRNGFYNYNYLVEDSYLDDCGTFNLEPHQRIHESNPNIKPFKYNEFYQDDNGKWFFMLSRCWVDKDGFAYGFEVGFRRIGYNKTNAVIRLYHKKKWS